MSKKNEYRFKILFSMENYKKWVKKIIFDSKNLGFWEYVNRIIIRLLFLLVKK